MKPSGRSWGHLEADSSHLGTTFDKTRAILQRSWGGGGYERIVNERSDVTDVRKLLIKSVGQKLGDKIKRVGGQNLYARLAAQKDVTLTIGDAYVAFNLIM